MASYNKLMWVVVVVAALVMALVVVAESSSIDDSQWDLSHMSYADDGLSTMRISDDNEDLLDSESSRRQLAAGRGRRVISYAVLKKNNVPCNRRGQSYYSNCQGNARVNPYNRGCTFITRCARYMG